jgi:hypothetical protein
MKTRFQSLLSNGSTCTAYVPGYTSTCPDLQSFDVLATRHQGGRVYISIHSGLRKGDPRNEPREDGLVVCDGSGREIGFIQDECFEVGLSVALYKLNPVDP